MSKSELSRIERGQRALDRRSTNVGLWQMTAALEAEDHERAVTMPRRMAYRTGLPQ